MQASTAIADRIHGSTLLLQLLQDLGKRSFFQLMKQEQTVLAINSNHDRVGRNACECNREHALRIGAGIIGDSAEMGDLE